MRCKTKFISVEVTIKTDHPHESFVEWFETHGDAVIVVPCDTHRSYVYFAPLPLGTPDETIRHLCQQIAALNGPPRQQWDAAGVREFYLGYEAGDEPFCFEDHFSHETLLAVTAIGAGIGLAFYAVRDTELHS
jgi:hypothetical protein